MKSKWKSGIVIVVTIKNESKGFSDISVILMYLLFNIKGADTLLKCLYSCYQTCISLSDESQICSLKTVTIYIIWSTKIG